MPRLSSHSHRFYPTLVETGDIFFELSNDSTEQKLFCATEGQDNCTTLRSLISDEGAVTRKQQRTGEDNDDSSTPRKTSVRRKNYDTMPSQLEESDDEDYDSDLSSTSDKGTHEDAQHCTDVHRKRLSSYFVHRFRNASQLDKNDYMSRRTMTPLQERMNGLTVLPGAFYCIYYCFTGMWLWDNIDQVAPSALENIIDETTCRSSLWFQDLHVMPPLPILFIALGIAVHAPFSFIYHWHYCTKLPPGKPRFDHWSRKCDQAFIHVISTFMSYGTTGRWDVFAANAVFNAHCAWRNLVSTTATPLQTQLRILLSLVAYTIPFLQRGDTDTFVLVWMVLAAALWLFATYPIRGWSHTAFHVVAAFIPPILMGAAGELAASQGQIIKAAQCAALQGKL